MGRFDRTPLQRIIDKSTIGFCYIWNGNTGSGEYGLIRVENKTKAVHRVAWESLVGPIPNDLEIDHMCQVKRCWNVEHLRLVTPKENSAINIRHACRTGHRMLPQNRASNGSCVTCNNERERTRYRARVQKQTVTEWEMVA